MGRLITFRFIWTDAWMRIDRGYYCKLHKFKNGNVSIRGLANEKYFEINLSGIENLFIKDLESIGIGEWNQKFYHNPYVLDGNMWRLNLAYDCTDIHAEGMNGYPKTFLQYLDLMHNKYGMPKAEMENPQRISSLLKDIEITELTNTMFSSYYMRNIERGYRIS